MQISALRTLLLLLASTCYSAIYGQAKEAYLAEFNSSFEICELNEVNISYGTKIGNVVTLSLSSEEVSILQKFSSLVQLKKAAKVKPDLIQSLPDLRADSVHQGFNLETGYSGKDVIIGITDWGFDYTHPMFYDTGLQETRILAAWDQFKTSGPHPSSYSYGAQYEGSQELMQAEKDTYNVYEYATHGSHVAGIAGGGGAGIGLKGVAYDANFLLVTFLANEAAVIDGIAWMKKKAEEYQKRLVINMSWGLYNLGPLDGTSLLSQALDSFSKQGVIFVTSGGNNGDVNFHIKHEFNGSGFDTIDTGIDFYPLSAHPKMWGQSISMWGQNGFAFGFKVILLNQSNDIVFESETYNTRLFENYIDTYSVVGLDTIFYNISNKAPYPNPRSPTFRFRVQNKTNTLKVGIKVIAATGTVHLYNVVELTNDVGNWGMPFSAFLPTWLAGDNRYGIGEPASTRSVITVAAHIPERKLQNGQIAGGGLTNFSSIGPTIDERSKPDVSGPGFEIESSISSFTTRNYTLTRNATFKGKNYPFAKFSGTSMSSPATAGVVALMLQANPSLSASQAKEILIKTARTDNRTGVINDTASTSWGWGKVNALAAVKTAEDQRPIVPILKTTPTFLPFPNPAKDKLFFDGEWDSTYNATLYDLSGKTIITRDVGRQSYLNLLNIQDGLYLLKIEGIKKVFRVVIN